MHNWSQYAREVRAQSKGNPAFCWIFLTRYLKLKTKYCTHKTDPALGKWRGGWGIRGSQERGRKRSDGSSRKRKKGCGEVGKGGKYDVSWSPINWELCPHPLHGRDQRDNRQQLNSQNAKHCRQKVPHCICTRGGASQTPLVKLSTPPETSSYSH